MQPTNGIHHITAIASDPQVNVNFYEGFLGQRFIKKTVNFDDPSAYHLYYGDYIGTPGTAMTFFSWQGMSRGVAGAGEANAIYYRIPSGSASWWEQRARDHKVTCERVELFGETALELHDPDDHRIILIESKRLDIPDLDEWTTSPVPKQYGLQGFYGVRLAMQDVAMIAPVLTDVFGYQLIGEEGDVLRYAVESTHGQYVDVAVDPTALPARQGVGSVHHVAFRARDDDERELYRERCIALGLEPTGLVDRTFFHSTYFWTPAGILFEIATDKPGFTINEPAETLGETLVLPEQYEHMRSDIAAHLPPIDLPRHTDQVE